MVTLLLQTSLKRSNMTRTEQRETLLGKLRRDPRLYGDGPKAIQIGRLIELAKKLCASAWRERVDELQTERLNKWFAIQ